MIRKFCRQGIIYAITIAVVLCGAAASAVSSFDEEMSMLLRRAVHSETISSDIALRLAEMVFIRHYGHLMEENLPLEVTDHGDRWEVHGKGAPGQRLRMVVMKIDGRIVDLVAW